MRLHDQSGEGGFGELLDQVQARQRWRPFEQQDVPFEKLVDEFCNPQRDRSRNPLFQVMFAVQNAPGQSLSLEGLRLERMPLEVKTTHFDLEFHAWQEDGRWRLKMAYNTDLFDAGTIAGMFRHFRNLLAGIVDRPERPISQLSMLDAGERRQLLDDWNRTTTDYPRDATLRQLFECQAEATPDAIALDFDSETMTYAELNRRANRLARYLRSRGVGPEDRVGLYLARGMDAIIGLLAIVKAGGAYLPLDPDYPPSRIGFMLEDAGVAVLLTSMDLEQGLPGGSAERICVDRDRSRIARESADNPAVTTGAASLAYVIYTSGSTGTPKGVEISQRAILRLVRDTDYYQVGPADRVAQASNLSFDAATFEVWGALLNGASLVGIDKENLMNARSLGSILRQKSISAMFVTTAVFNQAARDAPDAFGELKCLMFGGEAVGLRRGARGIGEAAARTPAACLRGRPRVRPSRAGTRSTGLPRMRARYPSGGRWRIRAFTFSTDSGTRYRWACPASLHWRRRARAGLLAA